jgi:hypothetical protein
MNELPAIPDKLDRGIDELNFAEFPVCLFSSNPTHKMEEKTLVFYDEIPDKKHPGKTIRRRVTVSGTNKYGLPTATDDWVILGLFQMAKLQGFQRKLHFTRYHLLKLLGWGTNARDYNKLTDCLKRIQGVQFDFEKAWWDAEAKSWVNRTFNLYQDLEIYEDENSNTRPKPDIKQTTFSFACSSFEWSEFLHANFMNKGVRELNFYFAKSLKRPTSRRLFRFLGKRRLWQFGALEIDLDELATHMGLKNGQRPVELKRTIAQATKELVDHGCLKASSNKKRFRKVKPGVYQAFFESAWNPSEKEEDLNTHAVLENKRRVKTLADRGIDEAEAIKLVRGYPDSQILHQIEVMEWEIRKGKKVTNKAGYLRMRIVENRSDPQGFVSKANREKLERQKEEKKRGRRLEIQRRKKDVETMEQAERERIKSIWSALSEEDRKVHEARAFKAANEFDRRYLEAPGRVGEGVRWSLKTAYAKKTFDADK